MKWIFPVEIAGGDCLVNSVVNPGERFGSNQEAEGNLCDFRAISWEVEELEVD